LVNTQVALLSDRRKIPPYGLSGGSPGAVGTNKVRTRVRAVLAARQNRERAVLAARLNEVGFRRLPSKCSFHAPAGTVIRIETPGGGGWGAPERRPRTS